MSDRISSSVKTLTDEFDEIINEFIGPRRMKVDEIAQRTERYGHKGRRVPAPKRRTKKKRVKFYHTLIQSKRHPKEIITKMGIGVRMDRAFSAPKTCQWIEGESSNRRFCNKPTKEGKSYCDDHYVICYLPPGTSLHEQMSGDR